MDPGAHLACVVVSKQDASLDGLHAIVVIQEPGWGRLIAEGQGRPGGCRAYTVLDQGLLEARATLQATASACELVVQVVQGVCLPWWG